MNMNHHQLVAALGVASLFLAFEGAWLENRVRDSRFFTSSFGLASKNIIRVLYFLGLPYLSLISGLLPARFLGLKGLEALKIESFASVSTSVGAMLVTWLSDFGPLILISSVLGMVFLVYLVFGLKKTPKEKPDSIRISGAGVILDGVHWGFYRAILWLLTGSLYLGVVGSVVVMLIEYAIVARLADDAWQELYLLRFALGMIASVTFLFVPNLWLILALHLVLALLNNGLLRASQVLQLNSTNP